MKNIMALILLLLGGLLFSPESECSSLESANSGYRFDVGVGVVNITPREEVTLAGSPSPKKTSEIETPLFIKTMVISNGKQKLAIITLDSLKYPTNLATRARKQIEVATQIPANNIILCASHTHSGPLWSYYEDKLITPIVESVTRAVRDLGPCKIGTAKGNIEGVTQNRRVIKNGEAWNRWLLKSSDANNYPAQGSTDPELTLLAAVDQNRKYKAILYNYACHGTNSLSRKISADFPGEVQKHVNQQLGYTVPTLFLAGACGDVNPNYPQSVGKALGKELISSLKKIEFISDSTIHIRHIEERMPKREEPMFMENEIIRKWPKQLNHYRKAFAKMKQDAKPNYHFPISGFQIGHQFAIITTPVELFCDIGLNIKQASPFKNTMVSTLTNGASGYVPTTESFELGGYETWFGEHSFLTTRAGQMIQDLSLHVLTKLKEKN